MIKTNFKINKKVEYHSSKIIDKEQKDITKSEFEDFMVKSGASGSFMIFRSSKKEDELGIEEL